MDNWVGDVPLSVRYSLLFDLAENDLCFVADMCQLGWDEGERGGSGEGGYLRGRTTLLGNFVFCHNIIL